MSTTGRAVFAALAMLSPLAATLARADSAIYLSWNDCGLSTASAQNFDFDCGTEVGAEELFTAFRMPFATGADVVGVIAVVDLQTFTSPLPDYWRLAKVGDCRAGYLSCLADFTLNADCVDPWAGQAVAEVQAYNEGQPRGATNQARIIAVAGVVPALARTLDATSTYYGLKLVFQNTRATGAAACAGCHDPVCLVLNSIEVKRLSGSPGGDQFLATPATGNGNWALWQQGTGVNCTAVPAKSMTWGRVKSLYR